MRSLDKTRETPSKSTQSKPDEPPWLISLTRVDMLLPHPLQRGSRSFKANERVIGRLNRKGAGMHRRAGTSKRRLSELPRARMAASLDAQRERVDLLTGDV